MTVSSFEDATNSVNVEVNDKSSSSSIFGVDEGVPAHSTMLGHIPEPCDTIHGESNDFKSVLANWAIVHNVPHKTCTGLLNILRSYTMFDLPKDARTLLRTPRKTSVISIEGGSYYHFGLCHVLEKMIMDNCSDVQNIDLLLNIDGLPLTKSSQSSLWPILCSNTINKKVHMVAAYFGHKKPENSSEFLQVVTNELTDLCSNGYDANGKNICVNLHALICDAPAKAFVLSVKSHTGFYSCTKCTIEGHYKSGRVCFPTDMNARLRTDEEFKDNAYEDFQLGNCLLNAVPRFGPVTNVPLDYMHLVCLGVVKKLISLWLQGPLSVRISARHVNLISNFLISLKNTAPIEVVRKPRPLKEFKQWKATEFRNFLLYTGVVVLKNFVKKHIYHHFISLSLAIRILASPVLCQDINYVSYAEALLNHFVTSFAIIYGEQYVSHNVHSLLHLCSDVRKFGPLDAFSAFRFENHMSSIKKLLRKSDKPLQQLARRYSEIGNIELHSNNDFKIRLAFEHFHGPLDEKRNVHSQYQVMFSESFSIRCNRMCDSCYLLTSGVVIIIENIVKGNDNELYVIGKALNEIGSFFNIPCSSLQYQIKVVGNLNIGSHSRWHISDIKCKLWAIPYRDTYIAFPLIHTNQ
uniref:DUF4218 domain-containing protein n=1 Tax=Photinus pyralis TaxID=7054 RepID=A0A1Y1KAV2_PHOPY